MTAQTRNAPAGQGQGASTIVQRTATDGSESNTGDTLTAILAARYGLSLPVARTVREAAFGLGGGHGA